MNFLFSVSFFNRQGSIDIFVRFLKGKRTVYIAHINHFAGCIDAIVHRRSVHCQGRDELLPRLADVALKHYGSYNGNIGKFVQRRVFHTRASAPHTHTHTHAHTDPWTRSKRQIEDKRIRPSIEQDGIYPRINPDMTKFLYGPPYRGSNLSFVEFVCSRRRSLEASSKLYANRLAIFLDYYMHSRSIVPYLWNTDIRIRYS